MAETKKTQRPFFKPHCPRCGRAKLTYRNRSDTFQCLSCGHVFDSDDSLSTEQVQEILAQTEQEES